MNDPRPVPGAGTNPYVGPVSFTRRETLYGRQRETAALADMVISRRIVLLYAPSGAGKTSLIQAALIPELERRHRFRISHVLRVNHVPENADPARTNRYVLSTLRNLEKGLGADEPPASEQLDDAALAGYTIKEYLDTRYTPAGAAGKRQYDLLVFDQFEEVFTLDSVDREAKKEFFRQLGEALGERDDDTERTEPLRWCLISMREDHIAELDEFRDLIPTSLAATFRMNLLEREPAREAIQEPARAHQVTIEDDAVRKLLDDLCKVRVADGKSADGWAPGEFIEPVQLQVVCRRLWDRVVHEGKRAISLADQAAIAGASGSEVDRALEEFYEAEIRNVAGALGVRERAIRDWFERALITPNLVRSQVLREHDGANVITPAVVDALIESHLLRGDKRGGREWVELTHDRLIQPVLKSNAVWRDTHLVPLQRQAELWEKGGRSSGYLLTGEALEHAEAQAKDVELSPTEHEFLAACRVERARAVRERRLKRWLVISAPIMVALTLISIYTAYTSLRGVVEADNALRKAKVEEELGDIRLELAKADLVGRSDFREALKKALRSDAMIAKSRTGLHDSPVRAGREGGFRQWIVAKLRSSPAWTRALFGVTDVEEEGEGDLQLERVTVEASLLSSLRDAPPIASHLEGHANAIRALAYAENGTKLLSAGYDGKIFAWDPASGARSTVRDSDRSIYSMAYDGARRLCAVGDASGAISLWQIGDGANKPLARVNLERATRRTRVTALAFHPDGERLVSTTADRRIAIWDVSDPARTRLLRELPAAAHSGLIYAVAVSHDGKRFVTADWDGHALVWDFAGGDAPVARLEAVAAEGRRIALYAIAFSPDAAGRYIAAGGADGSVLLWDLHAKGPPLLKRLRGLEGHDGAVFGVTFSPDGQTLASTGIDRALLIWDVERAIAWQPQQDLPLRRRITALPERIYSAAFQPDNSDRIALGGTHTVFIVDLAALSSPLASVLPDPDPGPERDASGRRRRWEAVAIVAGDSLIGATRRDDVRFWRIDPFGIEGPRVLRGLSLRHEKLTRFAVSTDGTLAATGNERGDVVLWSLDDERRAEPLKELPGKGEQVFALGFNRDHTVLAVGTGSDLALWSIADPKAPTRIDAPGLEGIHARSVSFSPKEDVLVAVGADPSIRLARVVRGRVEQVAEHLSGHQSDVNAVAFFPSGDGFVTTGEDLAVVTWSIEGLQAKERKRYAEHERGVVSVAAAEHGDRDLVFSADRDGNMIARLSAGDERHHRPLIEGFRRMAYIAANANGTLVVTTGPTVTLWDLRDTQLRRIACRIAAPKAEQGIDACADYRPLDK